MEVHCHELKDARVRINAAFELRSLLVCDEGHGGNGAMTIMDGNCKTESDAELGGFIE
jgi:hypothetical protein